MIGSDALEMRWKHLVSGNPDFNTSRYSIPWLESENSTLAKFLFKNLNFRGFQTSKKSIISRKIIGKGIKWV